jgi:TonB family protein
MRTTLPRALGAVIVSLIGTAASPLGRPALTAQTNWREVKSIRLGRFRSRIDASSQRTIRLFSQLDTSQLTGPELTPDSVQAWQELVFSELEKPTRTKYILGNAILVEPYAADSVTIGYALTVADTLGASRTVLTDRDGMQEFLDLLVKGAVAAKALSDAELKRAGPIVEKPVMLAKPVNFVYPRNAQLAGVSGSALMQFVVDTAGRAKPASITCLEATYKDFADAAAAVVKTMEFTPAELDGHKIEQLVEYPIDFKLNAVLPIKPFQVPVGSRGGRRR